MACADQGGGGGGVRVHLTEKGSDSVFSPQFISWADPKGAGGPGLPLKHHENIGFSAILVRIPWKITKLPSQYSMTGHHRSASETPFKWHFASGPIMAPACSGIRILSPLIN